MALNTALRGIVGEDIILVSDIAHGDKPSLGITFRNISASLSARPISGADASDHRRGDYWTDGTSYMVVINPVEQIWASPVNDSIQGGGGGLTPQQIAALRSRDIYARNTVYHDSTSAARPNVTNVIARADRLATFTVDGGWTHNVGDNSVYKADIFILASGEGDPDASGFSANPEELVQGSDGMVGPQGPKGDKGDTGDTGPQGERGPAGADGADGAQGVAGRDGAQGIQGPKGDKGDTGATGPQGEPGSTAEGAVTDVRVQGEGSSKQIVVIDGGINNALPIPGVPSGGNPGDVLTRQAVQGNLWNWVAPSAASNAATWAQTGNTDDVPDSKISNNFARRTEIEGEIALLEQAIQANVLPEQLRLFGNDVRVGKHPNGVWGQRDGSTVGMNIGGAFLVSNDETTTKGIPQEVGAVSGYSVANLPPAPNPNFVREHADPNEDSNPFLGVTPYCNGPVILTTPANQRRKVFTGIWGQALGTRPTDTNLTVENTMFSVGDKGLIRWNRAGIEVRTGADSAINRVVTQYLRIGTQNLSNLGNAAYTPPALATSYTGASQTFRLVANEFDADESVARQSPFVDVEANASTKGFTIPLNNRAPLTGNITYNGSTRVATINITGGSQAPGSHIELDVRVRNTFTYTRPSRTVYEALVLEDDVVRAGVREIFTQNNKNVFVFAFEKQYDEDDSNDNIMKLVFRINGITREINLHQTYGELGLGGTEFRIGASLQYVSHIQASTSTEDLGTADLLALDVEQIGWGQLQRNHRDDNVNILAILAAHGFGRLNADGTVTPFEIPASWAQLGNAQKIPAEKLNLSATNPSGIINPVVLDIPHFDGTTDVDTGRPVDGANSWRSQFQLITFIASYGKGGSGSAAASATPTFKAVNIPIDALPANRPAGWERFIEIDSYDGTFEKVGVRVFQPASSNGQANLHFHLYYQNHSPRQIFRAIIPGAIGRFANLRIAQFHDFGGQAYVMPRSAKGEQGDEGPAGPKGDTGATGGVGPKGDKGDTGEQGPAGTQGAAGAKGDKGDPGQDGAQGLRGPQGPAGADGAAGAKGDKGDTGEQGIQGIAGRDGADGARGQTGPQGIQGPKGDKGDTGETGPQGERGLQGPQGPAGTGGGGGGTTISGTSGWGSNLLAGGNAVTVSLYSGSAPGTQMIPVDLSGDTIDSLMIEFEITAATGPGLSNEIIRATNGAFSSAKNAYDHSLGRPPSTSIATSSVGFAIVGSGASSNIRIDWARRGGTAVQSGNIQIVGVYKRTIISGSAVGPQGIQGIQGIQGPKGDKGDSGQDGADGAAGAQGPKGDKGDTGERGLQGVAGQNGARGEKGDTGETGPQGPAGADGAQGERGEQGLMGAKGDPGEQGVQGERGPQGVPGVGAPGDEGTAGPEGPRGPQGIAGPEGPRGPQGEQGVKGDTGDTGAPGAKGDKGDDGERGPQGVAGQDGAQGLRGPQGETGPAGPAGADGADGAQGPKGDKGDTGATGPAGPPGTGGVGTVSGTSGWGSNLLSADITVTGGVDSPTSASTVNLSGEVDSVLVICEILYSSNRVGRNSVEILSPSSTSRAHNCYVSVYDEDDASDIDIGVINFSFPTTTGANAQIRIDGTQINTSSGEVQANTQFKIVGLHKKTRITGTAPSSGGGLNQDAVDTRVRTVGDARYSKIPVVNNNYLHLGNADLDTQGGVVSVGGGAVAGQRMTGTSSQREVEQAVRFLGTATTNNVPTGATYTELNGNIVLPAGHWIVCAAVNLRNPVTANNSNNHRQYACLAIDYDGNERHCNSVYMRNRDPDVVNIQGKVSVTGAVITDGTKVTTIRVRVDGDGSALPGDITVYSAHVHAYRQLI